MALKLAEECNQHYIVVTYDLAIASKAYKIQADMKKEFEKLFINLGAFHIELAYFKVSIKNQMILSSILLQIIINHEDKLNKVIIIFQLLFPGVGKIYRIIRNWPIDD